MIKKIISYALCLCVLVTVATAAAFPAAAETTVYSFDELLKADKVKILGRSKKDIITAYWAGNGIELNINNLGGDVTLKVLTTEPAVYFEAFIDGESIGRSTAPATMSNSEITFTGVPEGEHLLRIVRETDTSKEITAMTLFDSITFNGTVLEKPNDREFFVEIIGDSVACGAGSLGVFGDKHKTEYHSATHSFGYYIANELKADYSIIAAGGIGLYVLSSDKKEWYNGVPANIQKMYEYTNGIPDFDMEENLYDFSRKPDLIIIRIGANDDTGDENTWKKEFVTFVERLRELNGKDVPIVFSGKAGTPHYISVQNAKSVELKGQNIYLVSTDVGGSGTAALSTQKTGHPNAAEQKELADSILKVIKDNGLDKPLDRSAEETDDTDGEDEATTIGATDDNTKLYIIIGAAAVMIILLAVICISARKRKNAPAHNKTTESDGKEETT